MSKRPKSKRRPIRKEQVPRRNEPCPCGSGKKAKHCCLSKIKALAALPPRVRQQFVVANILGHPTHSPATIEKTDAPTEDTQL